MNICFVAGQMIFHDGIDTTELILKLLQLNYSKGQGDT